VDPISLIVAALAAGAAGGLKDAAGEAVKDGYNELRGLLQRRFGGKPDAEIALEKHAEKPEVWEAPLRDALAETGADRDEELIAAARKLLEAAGQSPGRDTFNVNVSGDVTGWQQGSENVLTINQGEGAPDDAH
jgi:hypothetical protein